MGEAISACKITTVSVVPDMHYSVVDWKKIVGGVCLVLLILALAAGLAALLGGDSVEVGTLPNGDQVTTETGYIPRDPTPTNLGPVTASPCSATTPLGRTYNPCDPSQYGYWTSEMWNPINNDNFSAKWKTSNPGEWNRLEAYRKNGLEWTGENYPPVSTWRGRLYLAVINQCKVWVDNPQTCASP